MLKRVLLKVSGEALCKKDGSVLDFVELGRIVENIKIIVSSGVEIAVVIGAGNIVRGKELCGHGVSRAKADNIGMVATIINALVLQDELLRKGIEANVLSTFYIYQVVEPYVLDKCQKYLNEKRVVILSGGTGSPYFTTDTAAALRAAEINADMLLKATKVDGVYSDDPIVNKDAVKFDRLSYMDVLNKDLKVMDATAVTLCMDNDIPIVVFDMNVTQNFQNIVNGKAVGTYIGSM